MPITIIGGPELAARFRRLDAAVKTVVLKAVLDDAADAAAKAAQDLAPDRTGALKGSIKRTGSGMSRNVGYGEFYGTFVVKGTGERHKKSGAPTGSMPKDDFLTPALADPSVTEAAQAAFERRMHELGAV